MAGNAAGERVKAEGGESCVNPAIALLVLWDRRKGFADGLGVPCSTHDRRGHDFGAETDRAFNQDIPARILL